jgi:hypothetical protein
MKDETLEYFNDKHIVRCFGFIERDPIILFAPVIPLNVIILLWRPAQHYSLIFIARERSALKVNSHP